MNRQYFCAFHAEKMRACESDAYRYWMEVMRRGVLAYAKCRAESALIYLHTAVDIGLLRKECQQNGVFEDMHVTKPAEFLIQLFITDDNFEDAFSLLSRISSANHASRLASNIAKITKSDLSIFLEESYEQLKTAEKDYLTDGEKNKPSASENKNAYYTHKQQYKYQHAIH